MPQKFTIKYNIPKAVALTHGHPEYGDGEWPASPAILGCLRQQTDLHEVIDRRVTLSSPPSDESILQALAEERRKLDARREEDEAETEQQVLAWLAKPTVWIAARIAKDPRVQAEHARRVDEERARVVQAIDSDADIPPIEWGSISDPEIKRALQDRLLRALANGEPDLVPARVPDYDHCRLQIEASVPPQLLIRRVDPVSGISVDRLLRLRCGPLLVSDAFAAEAERIAQAALDGVRRRIADWLMTHGSPSHVASRLLAGVLPRQEYEAEMDRTVAHILGVEVAPPRKLPGRCGGEYTDHGPHEVEVRIEEETGATPKAWLAYLDLRERLHDRQVQISDLQRVTWHCRHEGCNARGSRFEASLTVCTPEPNEQRTISVVIEEPKGFEVVDRS